MSDNIKLVDFRKAREPEINHKAVELLEDMLAHAKSGYLVAVAVAAVTSRNSTVTALETGDNGVSLSGAISYLGYRTNMIIDGCDDVGTPTPEEPPRADETDPVRIDITENGAHSNGTPEN